MNGGRRRLALIALLAMLLVPATTTATGTGGLFRTLDGERAALRNYIPADRWLVLVIWSHTCPVCRAELGGYSALFEQHRDGRLTVLGLSLDGESGTLEAWAFIEELDLAFPSLIGEPAAVADFFRRASGRAFQGTPTLLVYAPGGVLKGTQAGAVPPAAIEAFIASLDTGS